MHYPNDHWPVTRIRSSVSVCFRHFFFFFINSFYCKSAWENVIEGQSLLRNRLFSNLNSQDPLTLPPSPKKNLSFTIFVALKYLQNFKSVCACVYDCKSWKFSALLYFLTFVKAFTISSNTFWMTDKINYIKWFFFLCNDFRNCQMKNSIRWGCKGSSSLFSHNNDQVVIRFKIENWYRKRTSFSIH